MATQIDFTMAREFVSDIQGAKENLDSYIAKIEESLNNLYVDWKGDCADAFQIKSSSYLEYLKKISGEYDNTATQISAIIDTWVAAEEANTETATTRTC